MSGTTSTGSEADAVATVVVAVLVVAGGMESWLSTAGVPEEDDGAFGAIGEADTSLVGTGVALLVALVVALAFGGECVFAFAATGCFASSSSMLLFSFLQAFLSVRANYSITHHIYYSNIHIFYYKIYTSAIFTHIDIKVILFVILNTVLEHQFHILVKSG